MILPSTYIKLIKARKPWFVVSWPASEFNGAKIPAHTEEFATREAAVKASGRFDVVGIKGTVTETFRETVYL